MKKDTTAVLVVLHAWSYHVLESSFEVPSEGTGFMALDFAVLDWCPLQEIIHVHRKDGRRSAFILRAA